jgi:hypothetical protein
MSAQLCLLVKLIDARINRQIFDLFSLFIVQSSGFRFKPAFLMQFLIILNLVRM